MDRREFLKYFLLLGGSIGFGITSACAKWLTNDKGNDFLGERMFIDAHAHPNLYPENPLPSPESSIEKIKKIGMNASCIAVCFREDALFDDLKNSLLRMNDFLAVWKIRIIKKHTDVPQSVDSPRFTPGVILAVEGATSLGTDLDKVNEIYELGVRQITPIHRKVNAIGSTMTDVPSNGGGLTEFGQQIVERMISLGIIVDVAHAYINTLKGIVEIARFYGVPIIDSHTSLIHREVYGTTRARTFKEMEMVAGTGGVVCTCPSKWYVDSSHHRTSFLDWAKENLEIAQHIGFKHIGLGTDAGGGMPELIDGYKSILDLPKLWEAMSIVGFNREQIGAYMGGNYYRVIRECLG